MALARQLSSLPAALDDPVRSDDDNALVEQIRKQTARQEGRGGYGEGKRVRIENERRDKK